MSERAQIEELMRELYANRLRGDLPAVCRSFSEDAEFRIVSSGQASPIAIIARGIDEFRPLLELLIKAFRLSDLTILFMSIDGVRAAVYWQANVRSKITGGTVPTEMIDLVEVSDGRIVNFREFAVPSSISA
jgi:ketosteroid isomerase-like protein